MSLLREDKTSEVRRGSIFKYSPIFWLKPPLWIARIARWATPRSADIYKETEVKNAFGIGPENEEFVLATAKKRFVVVLSHNREAIRNNYHELLIAPIMSIENKGDVERRREIARGLPEYFYLEADSKFPELMESYINLRDTRLLNKEFLADKAEFCLTEVAIRAVLNRYRSYLLSV